MSHRDVVVRLAQDHAWRRGAELGLARGMLFGRLLRECPNLHMIGVDLFKHPSKRASVRAIEQEHNGRCTVLAMSTVDAADRVKSESLDFVFVDAGHGYTAVRDDIDRWKGKVRKHGWMMGHDYDPVRNPGVVKAVDEAFGEDVITLPFAIWVHDHGIGRRYLDTIRNAFAS